jgi:hypothetical protein
MINVRQAHNCEGGVFDYLEQKFSGVEIWSLPAIQ